MNISLPRKAGWVVRDVNGTFKFADQDMGNKITSALEAEFQALIIAMQHCWTPGYTSEIFEGDNQKMIEMLDNSN